MKPNLFKFATSELSQDAILCWIAQWADPRFEGHDKPLHNLGRNFLQALFAKENRQLPQITTPILPQKQKERIDILIEINGTTAVSIEDKVGSTEHDDQLKRYLDSLKDKYSVIIPVYVQTGEQGNYHGVENAGYKIMHRGEILSLLEGYRGEGGFCSIIDDYYDYLSIIDKEVNAFRDTHPAKWEPYAWQGFYCELQRKLRQERRLDKGVWEYVFNRSRPFYGYYWPPIVVKQSNVYLQIEQGMLCFKIEVKDGMNLSVERDLWSKRFLASAQEGPFGVVRPRTFGSGRTMTVALWNGQFPVVDQHGKLNIDKTIDVLRQAADLLEHTIGSR
jgi:hypothetical protein